MVNDTNVLQMQRGQRVGSPVRNISRDERVKLVIARRLAKRESGACAIDLQPMKIPSRDLTRLVKGLSLDELVVLRNVFAKYQWVFPDAQQGEQAFLDMIAAPDSAFWQIPGKAVFYFTDIRPGNMAFAHIIVYDKGAYRSTGLLKDIIREVMDYYGLRRMNALIPGDNRFAFYLARTLGFRREGCFRKWILRRGQWADMIMLGLLRREI